MHIKHRQFGNSLQQVQGKLNKRLRYILIKLTDLRFKLVCSLSSHHADIYVPVEQEKVIFNKINTLNCAG